MMTSSLNTYLLVWYLIIILVPFQDIMPRLKNNLKSEIIRSLILRELDPCVSFKSCTFEKV